MVVDCGQGKIGSPQKRLRKLVTTATYHVVKLSFIRPFNSGIDNLQKEFCRTFLASNYVFPVAKDVSTILNLAFMEVDSDGLRQKDCRLSQRSHKAKQNGGWYSFPEGF